MSGNHRGSLLRQRVNAALAGAPNANKIGGISPAVVKHVSKVFRSNNARKIYNKLKPKNNNVNKAALNSAAARLARLVNNNVNTLKKKANKAAKNVGNLRMKLNKKI